MIWDWVEEYAHICDGRRDPVAVSWAQVASAEGISGLMEVGTRYVAHCEGDVVPLHAHLPYISGASLEEGILALASLKDGDSGLVVAEQVEELVHELWGPQFDDQCCVENLELTDGGCP